MERADGAHGGTKGWVVGRAAGAPVVVSPGWVVAAVVLTLLFTPTVRIFAPGIGGEAYVVALAFVLLLFGSVFLHELAHATVARRRGLVVRELAVTLWGGHTQFGAAAPTPSTSALVAIAGPAVNLVLAGLSAALWTVLPSTSLVALLVGAAAVANAFVGAFNLVPGLPLDGGRVLEALVWRVGGSRHRGTLVAAWVGRAVAAAIVLWALAAPALQDREHDLLQVVWSVLIASFLWSGASRSVQGARGERAVEALSVRDLMTPAVGAVATATLDEAVPGDASGPDVVLLGTSGEVLGVVERAAAAAVPVALRGSTPLTAVAVPLPPGAEVDGSLTGNDALRAVAAAARLAPVMVVTGPGGRVVGLLRAQDVVTALRPST
ncbi:site-2 protease family protein [Actinotalea sp. K2]|uniref:site-2 protease family protein n=1 Tax=Actinotalea sp. K2 TaxID=2939438 RepID=UPI002018294F|nr:site-2 protease family protein [Actinotalea sp. K2]MCL3861894.1 site-2 protease family protein [Actinotalea sp. K2]